MKKISKTCIYILGIIIFIYIMLCFLAEQIQTYITFPVLYNSGRNQIQGVLQYKHEIINIPDQNGNNINGIYIPFPGKEAKTVYYFHGNGGPLPMFYKDIEYIYSLGYNVMAYDYPSYGKSSGFPYKEKIDQFSQIFYEYMKQKKGFQDTNILIWGYSIGTAIATDFASKNNFEKLILIAPIASQYDTSTEYFGFPLQKYLFLDNNYKTIDLIKNIQQPLMIVHGRLDKIISIKQGQAVFQNHMGEKHFIEIKDGGHNNLIQLYGNSLKPYIVDFLNHNYQYKRKSYEFIDKNTKKILQKEKQKLNIIMNHNVHKDTEITKYVDDKISFQNLKYIPKNLKKIESDFVYDTKGESQLLRKEAQEALESMAEAFFHEFHRKIDVISAYRSYIYQKKIKQRGCSDQFCAKAGYSEHQSGLAVDLWETTTNKQFLKNKILKQYFEWLQNNAYKYGFHNTYQKGKKIDGYVKEPWHWRYLGIPLASYLKKNNITFAEFYYEKEKSRKK